jgi:hypothetical protein
MSNPVITAESNGTRHPRSEGARVSLPKRTNKPHRIVYVHFNRQISDAKAIVETRRFNFRNHAERIAFLRFVSWAVDRNVELLMSQYQAADTNATLETMEVVCFDADGNVKE